MSIALEVSAYLLRGEGFFIAIWGLRLDIFTNVVRFNKQ